MFKQSEQISLIKAPIGASLILENDESVFELRDLQTNLKPKEDVLFKDFKYVVEQSSKPIFVMDTHVLKE